MVTNTESLGAEVYVGTTVGVVITTMLIVIFILCKNAKQATYIIMLAPIIHLDCCYKQKKKMYGLVCCI